MTRAIEHTGLTKAANLFGVYPSVIQKFRDRGFLPESDVSGRTQYAAGIASLTEGKFTEEQLLEVTRDAWKNRTVRRGKRKRIGRAA